MRSQRGPQAGRRHRGLRAHSSCGAREINGILYCNDGDWVESCTSLVGEPNGRSRLIDWARLCGDAQMTSIGPPVGQAA